MSVDLTPSIEFQQAIAKKISDLIISNYDTVVGQGSFPSLAQHQRTIIGGKSRTGRVSQSQRLLIYGSDLQAAFEDSDVILQIGMNLNEVGSDETALTLVDEGGWTIKYACQETFCYNDIQDFSNLIFPGGTNPQNVGQYINISSTQDVIDLEKAKEILDTEITELIPNADVRQKQIDDFFRQWSLLKPPVPDYDIDGEPGPGLIGGAPPSPVDGEFDAGTWDSQYNVDEQEDPYAGFIVRLTDGTGKTLEDLRDELNNYLRDIDEVPQVEIEEERPKYKNKSSGYIKLRSLNQGIIVRRQEGDDVGISEIVTTDIGTGPSYLVDGFTITIWTRFLDKVNTGTLFNYGNPTRSIDPMGFKLETFVINKFESMTQAYDIGSGAAINTWGDYASYMSPNTFPAGQDNARFVRLILYDNINQRIYDSHFGSADIDRITTADGEIPEFGNAKEAQLLNYEQIPIDFEEWYFIIASYNPSVQEQSVISYGAGSEYFWKGYMDEDASLYTSSPSGWGAKCKVESISKSTLIRAQGYAPE